ncbi:unknown [Salmonella phage FelixO1]|uniref:Uncharacterized protein n=1 Tax=Salmonella phage Felix O1 (isolate Felix O1-VT1) TaxID=1283336 RepID=Q6KGH4_BPFO1|nr:unknown [Salmonella phage FelixO1]
MSVISTILVAICLPSRLKVTFRVCLVCIGKPEGVIIIGVWLNLLAKLSIDVDSFSMIISQLDRPLSINFLLPSTS